MNYKYNLAIFCKTCIRDVECLKQLLQSINSFNKDNIPVCVSIARKEESILTPIIKSFDNSITIFIDEDINPYVYENKEDLLLNDWIPQQLVKLELYKTSFAKHYIIIDSDCYFIKDFYIKDFLFNDDVPYIPITDYFRAEKFPFQLLSDLVGREWQNPVSEFLNRKGKPVTIDLPWVLTSDYMELFERYLAERNKNFKDIIMLSPFEMQWYLEFVLLQDLPYIPCSTLFFPFHIETQYQIYRWLGFDEDIIKNEYLGIVMNKGHVKSIRYKPLWFGQNIIRRLIRLNYERTKGRDDYKTKNKKISLLKTIFSVTNHYSSNKKYKVITILGIKFKIKTMNK